MGIMYEQKINPQNIERWSVYTFMHSFVNLVDILRVINTQNQLSGK